MCWVCEQLDLRSGDLIEVRAIEDQRIKERFPWVEVGSRGVAVVNDDFFRHIPEMITDDPKHFCIVWENQEPCNVLVLFYKMIAWAKVGHVTPRFQ